LIGHLSSVRCTRMCCMWRKGRTKMTEPNAPAPNRDDIDAIVARWEQDKRVDLVCQGGGVRGIGLVGAYSVLEARGYQPNKLAGTSAGAVVVTLIAAGYTAK